MTATTETPQRPYMDASLFYAVQFMLLVMLDRGLSDGYQSRRFDAAHLWDLTTKYLDLVLSDKGGEMGVTGAVCICRFK